MSVRGGSLTMRSSATHWVGSQVPVSPGGQSQMYPTLPTAPTKYQMDISVQTVSQRGWRDMVLSTVLLFLPLFVFSALRSHKKHYSSFSYDGSQQFLKSFTETPKYWCYFPFNRREEPAGEGKPFCCFSWLHRKPSPRYCYYLPTWQAVRPADLFWCKLKLLEKFIEKIAI